MGLTLRTKFLWKNLMVRLILKKFGDSQTNRFYPLLIYFLFNFKDL